MKAYEEIVKIREYINYLEEHIRNVEKAWKEIKTKCKDMRFIWDDFLYFNIEEAVLNHDISKFSEKEFIQYKKYFYPSNDDKKNQTENKKLFEDAWEHHKEKNDHHWETWTTIPAWHPSYWELNCVHMVIDWLAMSYKFNDSPKKYYENNKENIILPDYAIDFIYEIFKRLEASDNNSI